MPAMSATRSRSSSGVTDCVDVDVAVDVDMDVDVDVAVDEDVDDDVDVEVEVEVDVSVAPTPVISEVTMLLADSMYAHVNVTDAPASIESYVNTRLMASSADRGEEELNAVHSLFVQPSFASSFRKQ
jgi:hypothetical protein